MNQKIKRVLLVLCMAVCFLALSACGKKNDALSEPVPENIVKTMTEGAENYLKQFDSYDDATIESEKKKAEKQDNTVLAAALDSWRTVKGDLGAMVSVLSAEVERVEEDSYIVHVTASFEKRELEFNLTAEENYNENYGGGIVLVPTELSFNPYFTTGEKLEKAALNTLMGMGTVFVVLIFISFIISRFKNINEWEAKMRAKAEEKEREEEKAALELKAAAPVQTPAPAPVPVAAPAAPEVLQPVYEEPVIEEENLADDMELVAVITAAISAAASVPAEGLVVRSIRRKSAAKWKNA